MLKAVKRWFQAPNFPEDEDQTRSALLLSALLNTFIIALPVIVAGLILEGPVPRRGTIFVLLSVTWVALLGLRFVMIAGSVAPAGISTVFLMFTIITLVIYNLGTIRAPATSFYILVVVMAGLIVSRRAIFWTAGVSALSIINVMIAEINGLLPKPDLTVRVAQAVTFTVAMWITSILLFLAVQSIDQAMARAREELTARTQSEAALQQTNAHIEILHEIDRALLSAQSLQDMAKAALIRIRKLISCERASVTLFNFETCEASFLIADFDGMTTVPVTPIGLDEYGMNVIEQLLQNKAWSTDNILMETEATDLDKHLANEHGIKIWLSLPLLYQGQLIGALNLGRIPGKPFHREDAEIAHDIANQLAIALQQTNLHNALQNELIERQKLISELEERNDELTRFTYTVSHDLRSPLVTIKGFLGMLSRDLQDNRPDKVQNDFQRIAGAADKMDALLTDLLELSRIGRIVNPPAEVDTVRLIQDALDSVDARIRSRTVSINIASELPSLHGDRIRLREVFENLIDNAIKYMGDQTEPVIEIGAGDQMSEPVFYVKDNGMGIEKRYHARIFGLFEKLNPTIEGTGIGLALVKRIIETHGGKIWVESEGLGKGSTFCFTIPGNRK
jgi:signal transduction histidine kinase